MERQRINEIICKLFSHKWGYFSLIPEQVFCKRCGLELEDYNKKESLFMLELRDEASTVFGGKQIEISRLLRTQGRLRAWVVKVHENGHVIFEKYGMTGAESKKLYREKCQEYGGRV